MLYIFVCLSLKCPYGHAGLNSCSGPPFGSFEFWLARSSSVLLSRCLGQHAVECRLRNEAAPCNLDGRQYPLPVGNCSADAENFGRFVYRSSSGGVTKLAFSTMSSRGMRFIGF